MFTIQMLRNLVRGYILGSCPFKKVFRYFVNSKYFQVFESSLTSSLYIRVTKSYAARSGCGIGTRDGHDCCKLNCDKIEKSTSWQIYTVDLTLLLSRFRLRSLLSKLAYLHSKWSRGSTTQFWPKTLKSKLTPKFNFWQDHFRSLNSLK